MIPLRLEGMAQTDVGRVRDHNEDCYLALPHAGVWAVADGMGGHERGEWASAAIVEALAQVEADDSFELGIDAAAEAIHAANRRIYAESEATGDRMGSTVVAIVLRERRFGVLWAGDSRAYLLRDGMLYRLTRDHTQVQEMVDRGLLTPEAAKDHPMINALARAVGVRPELELDGVVDEMKAGDIFMLCSDGLYGVVDDEEIARLLTPGLARADPAMLIALCLERGAPDNVTVIIVAATEPTALRLVRQQDASA